MNEPVDRRQTLQAPIKGCPLCTHDWFDGAQRLGYDVELGSLLRPLV